MEKVVSTVSAVTLPSAAATSIKDLNAMKSPFTLPPLPYSVSALEPVIDKETLTVHHGKHHQTYVDKLNEAIKNENTDLKTLFSQVSKKGDAIRNNGGGHWNHSFFWTVMTSPSENQRPSIVFEKE